MTRFPLRAGLFAASALLTHTVTAADISPGNWEITVTMRVPGAEQAFGPYSRAQCLQGNDTKDPGRVCSAPCPAPAPAGSATATTPARATASPFPAAV